MRNNIIALVVLLLGAAILTSGCTKKHPLEGRWKTQWLASSSQIDFTVKDGVIGGTFTMDSAYGGGMAPISGVVVGKNVEFRFKIHDQFTAKDDIWIYRGVLTKNHLEGRTEVVGNRTGEALWVANKQW